MRFHNLLADVMSVNYPSLSDEAVYQEVRKINIAILQAIIYEEWLPQLLGDKTLPAYTGFNEHIHPEVSHLFEATIPLYFYTQTTSFVFKLDSNCVKHSRCSLFRTCNSTPDALSFLYNGELNELLSGMLKQSANRDDHFIVQDIRGYAPGPADFTRQDLIALLIQQSRYFHLPDYYKVREKLSIELQNRSSQYSHLWPNAFDHDDALSNKIKAIYGDDNSKIDVFIGGLLESNTLGPGPLFSYLIRDQFQRIRDGDRMFYENTVNGFVYQLSLISYF